MTWINVPTYKPLKTMPLDEDSVVAFIVDGEALLAEWDGQTWVPSTGIAVDEWHWVQE